MAFRLWPFVVCCMLAMASCGSLRPSTIPTLTDNYCVPSIQYSYDTTYLPKPGSQSMLQTDTSLIRRFSRHDLRLANAMGIIPLLKELIFLDQHPGTDALIKRIAIQQKIQSRFLLVSTQLAGLAAELDCEGERADQIANYLDQRDTRRIRRLTILSVVIGAATTVATALISSDRPNKVISIGGGVIGAGFGGLAAFSSKRTVEFSHPRNLLADIWSSSDQSSVYPPMIWYVLNDNLFSNTHQSSIRTNIRERWKNYVLNRMSAEQEQLYFGKGGHYEADDLHNRADMLNQLQSSVRSIHQDLQSLAMALSN